MARSNQPSSVSDCFWSCALEVRHANFLGIGFRRSSTDGRRMGKSERADVRSGAGCEFGRPTPFHRTARRSMCCYCRVLGYEYHSLSGSRCQHPHPELNE